MLEKMEDYLKIYNVTEGQEPKDQVEIYQYILSGKKGIASCSLQHTFIHCIVNLDLFAGMDF